MRRHCHPDGFLVRMRNDLDIDSGKIGGVDLEAI
jgi:hypothetical protein